MQGQDPISIVGRNVLRADRIWQGKTPHERTICAFNPEVIIFLDVLIELPLSTDGQYIVCNSNINVLFLKIRQFHLYDQFILGSIDVYRRRPRCQVGMTRAFASKVVLK